MTRKCDVGRMEVETEGRVYIVGLVAGVTQLPLPEMDDVTTREVRDEGGVDAAWIGRQEA
jgi:hypothetical protein